MPWLAAVAGAGAQIGSSAAAANASSEAREQAMMLAQQSVDDLTRIGVPPEEAMRLTLEKYRSAGQLTPELEQVITQGKSNLSDIQTDPRLQDAQMDVLDELRQRGEGGFNLHDKAALAEGLSASANQERGSRERILQDMAERGASTSGGALAAQLLNQQGAAERNNKVATDTAAAGYDNALKALAAGGTLAGQMQGTQFGQKAQQASAQDVIDRMNTEAMQGVQTRNVGMKNTAQQYNLGNAQELANANTDISNKEQTYNKALPQQTFNNQLEIAKAKAGARSGQAQTAMAGGNATAQLWGGIGSAAGKTGAAISDNMYDAEEKEKARQARYT